MSKFLERFFKKSTENKKTVVEQPQLPQKPKYDFVEQYVLVNPKNVLTRYDLFSRCKNVPVAVQGEETNTGFNTAIELPTEHFLDFLAELKAAPDEVIANPLMRTVYIINLKNNEKMFVWANLKHPKNPWMAVETKTLPFNVTPQINRAIVDSLKTFTR